MPEAASSNRCAGLSTADPWDNAPERWLLSQQYQQVANVIGWRNAVELGTWVFENKKPPCRKAGRNGDRRGHLAIPHSTSSPGARTIAAIIGDDAARALQAMFGGEILCFGSIEPASIPRRNRAIVEQLDDCGRVEIVGACFGLPSRDVRRIYLRETGRAFRQPPDVKRRRVARGKLEQEKAA